ncbi:MAG TPA: HlyD family efflux transporter periplasmic adaptor subunit [Ignavibacteriaceae bacterium]|nr:HlyD family efflux transporter periplasmic adaptor subunit [Ignavibacteriaceae bacterium]
MNYSKRFLLKLVSYLNLFLLSTALISCSESGNNSTESNNSGTPVEITNPVVMNLKDYLKLNANTVFLSKEIIRAPFQGYIEKIYKNIGDEVKPGDILFSIKTKESAASDSIKIKIGENIFNGSVLIKAKTNGILSELNYHNGDFISDGEQLAIVSNPNSLRIKLNVPYEESAKIKVGNSCNLDLPDGTILSGTIEKKVPSVDPGTQTQTYLIKVIKSKELPENLNIIVNIPFKVFNNAVVVPKNSIVTNATEELFWVMKLLNDTTAIRVDINKGIETDSLVQVLSPQLNVKDRIVATGSYGLADTSKIEIIK